MPSWVIVDASAFVAWADADERNHDAVLSWLADADFGRLVVPALCIAEACHIVGSRLGARAEVALIRAIGEFAVEAPDPDDMIRMAELMEKYLDFPLGAADASIVALAERLETDLVLTLDHRHFGAVRPAHAERLTLLP